MHGPLEIHGPHFDARLIGADGKLTRLHKGAKPQPIPPTPPPVRETAAEVQQAGQDEMLAARKRRGLNQTLLGAPGDPAANKTLLG